MAFNMTEEENRLGNECWEKDKQIAQLKADLAKFGGHVAGCAFLNKFAYGAGPQKCDCGFAEAKERWA